MQNIDPMTGEGTDASYMGGTGGLGQQQRQQRPTELHAFFQDVEELLSRVANVNDDEVRRLRSKVETSMLRARDTASNATRKVRDMSMQAATTADQFAHDRPWTAVSLAALAGAAIGMALTSSRR